MTQEKTITALFSTMAEQFPDHTAVLDGNRAISFCELDRAAHALARRLTALQRQTPGIAGIYMPPGIPALIAMVATLKAGHAYLPLDTTDPPLRTAAILDTARPFVMLTGIAEEPVVTSKVPHINLHQQHGRPSGQQSLPVPVGPAGYGTGNGRRQGVHYFSHPVPPEPPRAFPSPMVPSSI